MGSPCYHHSCIALKHGSLQLNSAVCSHKVTLLPPDCQLTEYGSVLLRVLSIWFLVQALMCFNQSGAGIRNCTRPRWVWKSITRLSKKKKYPVYIYNHGSQFFWKIQRKLPGLCWVFHVIWWFFDPDFFCKYQNRQLLQKWKTCIHWFQCVLLLCCSTTRPNSCHNSVLFVFFSARPRFRLQGLRFQHTISL